jgi:N-formylglutamate amidohydrolase
MILHIPHSSFIIPPEVREGIDLKENELMQELARMTDAFTDELFDLDEPHYKVVYPVSRIVCDPERFLDDGVEHMSKVGMGVVYTRTCDGRNLRSNLSDEERKNLIDQFYLPHHRILEKAVTAELTKHGRSLIVDCHSFPAKPLPYETYQSPDRPNICIGTDEFHTPQRLIDTILGEFEKFGYSTAVNNPFDGSIVPMAYYQKDRSVESIMIEVNRKLYMDETTGIKNAGFNSVKQHIRSILNKIQSQAGF